ncbi:hypothetical protein D3C74_399390 [compost metagenome]
MREQVELLEDHAHFFTGLIDVMLFIRNGLAFKSNLAARRLFQQVQTAQEGAFPGTAGSYDDYDLAFFDLQIDSFEDLQLAKMLLQVVNGDHPYSASFLVCRAAWIV